MPGIMTIQELGPDDLGGGHGVLHHESPKKVASVHALCISLLMHLGRQAWRPVSQPFLPKSSEGSYWGWVWCLDLLPIN